METEIGSEIGAGSGTENRPSVGPDGLAVDPVAVSPAPVELADVDSVEALLDQVDGALARLDDGSYGRCESCGTIIAEDRLAESPTARTCAGCPVPVAG